MKKKIVGNFRPYETPLIIKEEIDMTALVSKFVENPALHHVCVVDERNRLLGLINRKKLFKHIFFYQVSPDTMVSKLLDLITAEKSSDLMLTHFVTCTEEDDIYDVIRNMIEYNIREIPVVTPDGEVLGFITILMIMKEWLSMQ